MEGKKLKKSIITVLGKDSVGIIAKVCTYLANNNVNILDINQTITGGFFNMMMIVESEEVVKTFPVMASELEQILTGVYSSSYDDAMIVQDFIPGDDTRMRVMNCYSDRAGRVTMQCLGDVVLEEHTPLGIGSYGAIMTGYNEDINARIRGFLEEIGYVGFSNFDLKYDERDGSFKLFEINPRQGRSSYFTTASGKNLARYLVQDVLEQRSEPCDIATLDDEVLWTMIPLDVIRTYTSGAETLARIERLIAAGKVKQSYWSEDDKSLLRWLSFRMNQRNYRQQYAQCFNKRHVND